MKNFRTQLGYNTDGTECGYITLLSIIILSSVSVSITVSLLLLGIQSSQTSFAFQQSKQARSLTDACVEEALQEIRDSSSYSGSDTLTIGAGSCDYTVANDGGQSRTITATGDVDTITRKVELTIDSINPEINVTSWKEVADF